MTARKQASPSIKEISCSNSTIIDPQEISEAFNQHFSTIGPRLAEQVPNNVDKRSPLEYLSNMRAEYL